jgi:hypothetical protein
MERPEGKRPLGRSKHRWKDYIEMNVGEREWSVMD